MTIDASAVERGDRVRLRLEGGATVEATAVLDLSQNAYVTIARRSIYLTDLGVEEIDIIQRPLPTEPGLYVPKDHIAPSMSDVYRLRVNGRWARNSMDTPGAVVLNQLDGRPLVKLVREDGR